MNTIFNLLQKLQDPEYRKAFVASQINIGIPFQVRALQKARGWKQQELAKRAGMLQPRISAIQKPGKAQLNLETLRRLAAAFDVALVVKFAPFSELAWWGENFNPDSFDVPSFTEESEKAVWGWIDDRAALAWLPEPASVTIQRASTLLSTSASAGGKTDSYVQCPRRKPVSGELLDRVGTAPDRTVYENV